jgi:hypothetical protein
MLCELQLKNFRAFKDWTTVPFAPLTVILGQNNAGKSSIVSALLVLKQTLEDPYYGVQVPGLRLNGSQIDAGAFRDIVHGHNLRKRLDFRFTFNRKPQQFGPPLVALDIPVARQVVVRRARFPSVTAANGPTMARVPPRARFVHARHDACPHYQRSSRAARRFPAPR